jgi:hypothetical protein
VRSRDRARNGKSSIKRGKLGHFDITIFVAAIMSTNVSELPCDNCGAMLHVFTVQKDGANKGRQFASCPNNKNSEMCKKKGFKWMDGGRNNNAPSAGGAQPPAWSELEARLAALEAWRAAHNSTAQHQL